VHVETELSWASDVKPGQLVPQLLAAGNFRLGNTVSEPNGVPYSAYHHCCCATILLLQEDVTSQNCVLIVDGQTVVFTRKLTSRYLGREFLIS